MCIMGNGVIQIFGWDKTQKEKKNENVPLTFYHMFVAYYVRER